MFVTDLYPIDIALLVKWIILAFMIACLARSFNFFQKPNMIFAFYGHLLASIHQKYRFYKEQYDDLDNSTMYAYHKLVDQIKYKYYKWLILDHLTKPLGRCPYCNGTWIAIFYYWLFFGFDLCIFLFIGVVWFFIKLIDYILSEYDRDKYKAQ